MHVIRARKWVDCNYALATCSGAMHLGFVTDIYPSDLFPSVFNYSQSFSHTCFYHTKKKKHCIYIIHFACLLGWPKGLILPTTRFHAFKINFISRSHLSHPRVVSFSADPVYSSFFTVSPYLKSLSMVAANKLLHLLEVRAC